jgi:hypothetical protein
MLVTQNNLAKLLLEFDIQLPFATRIACSPVLPFVLLAITLVAIVLSTFGKFHPFANRWNGMLLVASIAVLAFYLWGMFSPLMQLIVGLSQ